MNENAMTCADCDELFADYFEGTLADDVRHPFDSHISSCARCQRLIRDVEGIRVEARNLPDLEPARNLWSGIETRIQPRVVSIESPPARQHSMKWQLAAAAALVVATSGVTYLATTRSLVMSSASTKTAVAHVAPEIRKAIPETQVAEESSSKVAKPQLGAAATKPIPARVAPAAATPIMRAPPHASLASSTTASRSVPSASEIAFAGEISQLQSVLADRRSQLDPETVRVVEDNLKLIDTAVMRAKAALGRDPASGFLTRQLDGVLQKKVELLRTVALLPASTE